MLLREVRIVKYERVEQSSRDVDPGSNKNELYLAEHFDNFESWMKRT